MFKPAIDEALLRIAARAGRRAEAASTLAELAVPPEAGAWSYFLLACRATRELGLADAVRPSDWGAYFLACRHLTEYVRHTMREDSDTGAPFISIVSVRQTHLPEAWRG